MGRVVLCLVDNFLGVVQQEGAKLEKRKLEVLEHGQIIETDAVKHIKV